MSFKSKQRAKHGHLFGDDPLNASTITSFDSPSTKASRPKSPMDPLSRSSSPGSNNHSPEGSIFGGIDVSKFGNKRNTMRSSTSLRPTASLKLIDDSDGDDDDFLFGGGRKTSTSSSLAKRQVSSSTSKSLAQTSPKSSTSELPTGSPRVNHSTIMAPTPLSPSMTPSSLAGAPTLHPQRLQSVTPPISSTPSPPPASTSPRSGSPFQISASSKQQQQQLKPNNTMPVKKPPPPPPPARRTHSTTKATVSPLVSSSTSSLSSFSSSTSSSPVMGHSQQQPLSNVPPPPPPRIHKKHQQQQALSKQNTASLNNNDNDSKENHVDDNDDDVDDEQTRLMRQQQAAMLEDEGTRAFAMAPSSSTSVLSPPPDMMHYDDPELYASVTQFHSLAISGSSSTPTNRPNLSFIPSNNISHSSSFSSLAPVTSTQPSNNISSNNNPWDFNMAATSSFLTPTLNSPFPTATTTTPLPTTGSAAKRQQDLDKRLKEMEPAKRTAFADLIANWHNGSNMDSRKDKNKDDDDDTQFFEHVASEQRDIGFAGIDGRPDVHEVTTTSSTRFPSSFDWQENSLLDMNPWS